LHANAVMRDDVDLFHATHANLSTGNALTAATLQVGITAMAKLTQSGVNLNLKPGFLIVPQDLYFAAAIILESAERVIASTSGGTFNPLRDQNIALVSDNRMGVAGVTDPATGEVHAGTATNWMLACPGGSGQTIEVGYVAGTGRMPTMRSFVLDQGQWGIGWDILLDIGVKALRWEGMHWAAGV
ncbi:unnamed protein product, partial [marine sediment metagenome]